ncbi:MAG: hypothetical protein B6229_06885 [Spirochaetaceae bacterium 4572_7]|nr:MAG: hypothetical protein B6229_06885 [Spirochaetaceae bacterium 4572_7]
MPPNTIAAKFEAYGKEKNLIEEKIYYFNKLGESSELAEYNNKNVSSHDLLEWTYSNGRSVWEYAIKTDSSNLEEFIKTKWEIMKKSIKDGLHIEGGLPDSNINTRRASLFLSRAMQNRDFIQPISKTMAYAMAIAEENVSAKEVVAAPTAKSAGVIPSVLTILMETYKVSETRIIRGLITAGFIGKLLFKQIIDGDTHSDIIIASAMASGAAVQILGGTPRQVIAAAAISLNSLKANHEIQENSHLDYVELNGIAAANAINNATLALLSDNSLSKEIDFFDELTQWNRQAINC